MEGKRSDQNFLEVLNCTQILASVYKPESSTSLKKRENGR